MKVDQLWAAIGRAWIGWKINNNNNNNDDDTDDDNNNNNNNNNGDNKERTTYELRYGTLAQFDGVYQFSLMSSTTLSPADLRHCVLGCEALQLRQMCR